MRSRHTSSCLPPAALLVLAAMMCGGSLAQAATAAAVLQRAQTPAARITEKQAQIHARQAATINALNQVRDRQAAAAAIIPQARQAASLHHHIALRLSRHTENSTPRTSSWLLTLIDLPPPAMM